MLPTESTQRPPELVLCIDAGGTKCSCVIASKDGIVARASSGPCNFKTIGLEAVLQNVGLATSLAIALLPPAYHPPPALTSLPPATPLFAAAWIGMAGLDSPEDCALARPRLAELWSLPVERVRASNDASLLSVPIEARADVDAGVVVIAGTGSIGYSFLRSKDDGKMMEYRRSGGWGPFLGDEGSGYLVGRSALRATLLAQDLHLPPSRFHLAVRTHYGCSSSPSELLTRVYEPSSALHPTLDPKARVASLAKLVFAFAFGLPLPAAPSRPVNGVNGEAAASVPDPPQAVDIDEEALRIAEESARGAAGTIHQLVLGGSKVVPSESTLVMGGGMSQVEQFQRMVVGELDKLGVRFKYLEVVDDVAAGAVESLAREHLG